MYKKVLTSLKTIALFVSAHLAAWPESMGSSMTGPLTLEPEGKKGGSSVLWLVI